LVEGEDVICGFELGHGDEPDLPIVNYHGWHELTCCGVA
jgi:hypothetical protein